jgi:hypothetical protein
MDQFSHEELQQVILKYNSEYKRQKLQINGKRIAYNLLLLFEDIQARLTD